MNDCVFCKIVSGEIPSRKVLETDDFLAFIDIHPRAPGQVQVIPKKHYRWVWDVPNVGDYFEAARKVANAQRAAFGTDWVLSKVVGEDVPHAHIWVYPNSDVKGDMNDLDGNAELIRKNME